MTEFEREFFKKQKFAEEEIKRFLENALHDLEIARKDPFSEVRFTYSFQALIKAGIALMAKIGEVKVRSIPGHHAKILEKNERSSERYGYFKDWPCDANDKKYGFIRWWQACK